MVKMARDPRHLFSMQHFTTAEKDVLYSIMNREDLNWRKLNLQTAVKTINQMPDCHVGSPLVILVGGTSNIIPFRRPFFFLIQLIVVLI
jgi:hypothetical protein